MTHIIGASRHKSGYTTVILSSCSAGRVNSKDRGTLLKGDRPGESDPTDHVLGLVAVFRTFGIDIRRMIGKGDQNFPTARVAISRQTKQLPTEYNRSLREKVDGVHE